MTSNALARLRRLCTALPKTEFDERFGSLPAGYRALALLVASVVVLTVPQHVVDEPGVRVLFSVGLGVGTLYAVTGLLVRYHGR